MEDIAKLIPNSIISLVGLAVIMGILIMLGTVFQEWAKALYRRSVFAGKEKRHESRANFEGIERRAENKELQHALATVLESMTENNREMKEFVSVWKESHVEMVDSIEEIKRKQEKNWKRLFDEELPALNGGKSQ